MPSPLPLRSAAFLILATATATASPAPSLFSLPPNWLESLSTTPATSHPRFPVVIPSLGPLAPIDARLALANAGVTLAADEIALISQSRPDSRSILFLRANQLTTDLVNTVAPGGFVDDFGPPYASIRLWFTESSPSSPPRTLLDQSIVCKRGERSTFTRSRPGTLDVQSTFAFSKTELPDIVSIESSGHIRTRSFAASWSGESSVYATNPSGTIIWIGNGSSSQSSAIGRLSLTFLPDTFDSRNANAIDAEIRAAASPGFLTIQSDLLPAPPDLSAEDSCAFIEPGTATPNAPRLVDARRWLASRGITTQPGESAWLVPRFGLLYVSARGPTRNAINGLVLHSYPPSALNLQLHSPSTRLFRNIPLHATDGTVSGRVSGLPFSPDAGDVGGWDHKDKMGMSVGVLYSTATSSYTIYPEDKVDQLIADMARADLVIGFNHVEFDYRVLQGYSMWDVESQMTSLDLLLDIEKKLGHRIKLDDIATASLGTGKTADGLDAIRWWREGKIMKIAEYCCFDVKVTKLVHEFGVRNGYVRFRDRYGRDQTVEVDWPDWQ